MIVDSIDFYGNPVIEKHYYTPAQLRKNKLFKIDEVEALIDHSLTARESLNKQNKDNKAEYIEVYELHGEFPKSYITGKESDKDTYTQQVHILSFTTEEKDGKSEYLDFTLYSGQEKNPYHICHLIKEEGRVMSIGAVEHLFEAQWMVNHNEKAIKDQLDLASKIIFQTSDPAYQGKNAHNLNTGSFLYHEANQPLTKLENSSNDIASLRNSVQNWQNQGAEATSTPDAMRGATMPSATAARQVEALQQEAHSLFELMTENKGLALEEIWREFVIPHIKTQLDTKDEIVASLADAGVKQIETIYIKAEATRRIADKAIEAYLADEPMPEDTQSSMEQDIKAQLDQFGEVRFLKPDDMDAKTWKEVFKDFEWGVEVEVTNEQHDKAATLTTLTTVLVQLAGMGDSENARMVLAKILEETGTFSPMELTKLSATPMPASMPQVDPSQLPSTTAQTPTTQTPVGGT